MASVLSILKQLSALPKASSFERQLQLTHSALCESFFYFSKHGHVDSTTKSELAPYLSENIEKFEDQINNMNTKFFHTENIQIRRSGLQFLMENFPNELKRLENLEELKKLDEKIVCKVNRHPPETKDDILETIPPTHHQWFKKTGHK